MVADTRLFGTIGHGLLAAGCRWLGIIFFFVRLRKQIRLIVCGIGVGGPAGDKGARIARLRADITAQGGNILLHANAVNFRQAVHILLHFAAVVAGSVAHQTNTGISSTSIRGRSDVSGSSRKAY